MPNRTDYAVPIHCEYCNLAYCDNYWECSDNEDTAKLKSLNEWASNFNSMPNNVFNFNRVERKILQEYLNDKHITIPQVFKEGIKAMEQNKLHPNKVPATKTPNGNHYVCFNCISAIYLAILYYYREQLPNSELPLWVTSRDKCWYGKNCHTVTNSDHAKKYNHICDQTKF